MGCKGSERDSKIYFLFYNFHFFRNSIFFTNFIFSSAKICSVKYSFFYINQSINIIISNGSLLFAISVHPYKKKHKYYENHQTYILGWLVYLIKHIHDFYLLSKFVLDTQMCILGFQKINLLFI